MATSTRLAWALPADATISEAVASAFSGYRSAAIMVAPFPRKSDGNASSDAATRASYHYDLVL